MTKYTLLCHCDTQSTIDVRFLCHLQPAVKHTWVSRRAVSYSKKPRWMQAKRRMKVWSRSNIIGILLLLLLAGDVETNPGPTTGMVTLDTIFLPCIPCNTTLAKHLGAFWAKPHNY